MRTQYAKAKPKTPMQEAKQAIGSWMYGIMSQMTLQQFKKIIAQMDHNLKFMTFKGKVQQARDHLKQVESLCTEAQKPYVAMSFFYGVKYSDEQDEMQGDDAPPRRLLTYEIDFKNKKEADVSGRINSKKDFLDFANEVGDLLSGNDQGMQASDEITEEDRLMKEALEALEEESNVESDHDQLRLESSEVDEVEQQVNVKAPSSFISRMEKEKEKQKNVMEAVKSVLVDEVSDKMGVSMAQKRVEEALMRATRSQKK